MGPAATVNPEEWTISSGNVTVFGAPESAGTRLSREQQQYLEANASLRVMQVQDRSHLSWAGIEADVAALKGEVAPARGLPLRPRTYRRCSSSSSDLWPGQ